MRAILIFSLIQTIFVKALADTLLPPDPFSVDDIKLDLSKNRPLPGEPDTRDKKDSKSDVDVKASTPIITGSIDKPTIDKAVPTVKSAKTESSDDSSKKSSDESTTKVSKMSSKSTFVDVPDNIIKSVEDKNKPNLRTETKETKPNMNQLDELDKDKKSKSETKGETESDESNKDETEGDKKDDPIMKSLEGAEKQLSEAFGAVKTKLGNATKSQKPIKVDCGTTRVRVVCSKKNQEGTTESEDTTKPEEKETEEKETSDSEESTGVEEEEEETE